MKPTLNLAWTLLPAAYVAEGRFAQKGAVWLRALALAILTVFCGCRSETATEEPLPRVPDRSIPQTSPTSEEPTGSTTHESQSVSRSVTGAIPVPETIAELMDELRGETDRLVQSYPNSPDAMEIKARVRFLLGENAAASECWRKALELNPNYAYAYCGLGRVAASRSDYEEAISLLRQAVSIAPELTDAVHELSDCLQKVGKVDEAIGVLESHLDRNPNSTETRALLGFAYLAAKDFQCARQAFEPVVARHPDFARAQFGLATCLARLGEKEAAAGAMKRHQKSQAQTRQRVTDARSRVDDLQSRLVDASFTLVGVCRVYMAHGTFPEAERLMGRVVQLHPAAENYALLGQVRAARGDRMGAMRALEKAVELVPGNAQFEQILQRLKHGGP